MKTLSVLLVLAVPSSVLVPLGLRIPQDPGQEETQEQEEDRRSPMARFQDDEQKRLTEGIEGSWVLLDYIDPTEVVLDDIQTQGFATFHDGFMQILMTEPGVRLRLFRRAVDDLWVWSGAYRYRIDPLGFLQTQSVMGFDNSDGLLLSEDSGQAEEYQVLLQDGELVLRRNDGVTYTFRSATAGEFPVEAIQDVESRRGISGETRGDD